MNRLSFSVLTFVLALGVALAAGCADVVEDVAEPVACTLAFVDMENLMREHPATKAKTEGFQIEFEARMDVLRNQVAMMTSLGVDVELLEPGSLEHLALLKRIKKLEATLDLERKIIRIEFQLKVVEALRDVYGRCKAVVKQVAEQRGFGAVAMISDSEVQGRTKSELVGDILTRPFIYAHDSLDITDEVLAILVK